MHDLRPDARFRVRQVLGISEDKEANLDIVPLFELSVGERANQSHTGSQKLLDLACEVELTVSVLEDLVRTEASRHVERVISGGPCRQIAFLLGSGAASEEEIRDRIQGYARQQGSGLTDEDEQDT